MTKCLSEGFCSKLDFFQNLFSFLSSRDSVARNALFRCNKKSTSTKSKRRLIVAAYAARGGFVAKKKLYKRAQTILPAPNDKCY